MTPDVTPECVERAVNDLGELVWEAQSSAVASAASRCAGLRHATYPYLRPVLARTLFREELAAATLPDGWELGGNPVLMAQTLITGHGTCLRYLKERRTTYPGGVPAAGPSASRRAFWRPTLFTQFRDGEWSYPGEAEEAVNLLLLWDYLPQGDNDSAFTMRIVHPTGVGQHGRRTPFDISVDLVPGPGLEQGLRFCGDEEDTDFYTDIDGDMEQEDGS